MNRIFVAFLLVTCMTHVAEAKGPKPRSHSVAVTSFDVVGPSPLLVPASAPVGLIRLVNQTAENLSLQYTLSDSSTARCAVGSSFWCGPIMAPQNCTNNPYESWWLCNSAYASYGDVMLKAASGATLKVHGELVPGTEIGQNTSADAWNYTITVQP